MGALCKHDVIQMSHASEHGFNGIVIVTLLDLGERQLSEMGERQEGLGKHEARGRVEARGRGEGQEAKCKRKRRGARGERREARGSVKRRGATREIRSES
jgi:hypothetical protein